MLLELILEMAESVLSKRGKTKLVHENHVYVFSKFTSDKKHLIWVCEKRSTCKGRVWSRGIDGEIFKVVTDHNHAAQAARPEAIRIIDQVKEHAARTQDAPQQILSNVLTGVHADVAAVLPRKDTLKKTVRNVRRMEDIPALPRNVQDLLIPQVKQVIVN